MSNIYARVNCLVFKALAFDRSAHPRMIDGRANICVTGILGLFIDVVSIPPLPISVATKSNQASHDYCCKKLGFLPLTLDDDSIYYQVCYFCKNASETIILLDANLQSSNILTSSLKQGHQDVSSPGSICATSNSG